MSKQTKFTPGPWAATKRGISPEEYFVGPQRNAVAKVYCDVDDGGEANANLIAAAPDLLEAAQKLVSGFWRGSEHTDELVKNLEKAIAKAEGEKS